MNILFLTLLDFSTLEEKGIYTDLMREFVKNNHNLFIISPTEKRNNQPTKLIDKGNYKILKLQIGNTQKTSLIEKGISIITLENKFMRGIKNYFSKVKFDLVIYSTPPITLQKAVEFVKKRDNAKSYLLLKDIFPQNAVDLGMLKKNGAKGVLYSYFRNKEKKLYQISDYIGCMSKANVDFIIENNPDVPPEIVEICPNSIEPIEGMKDSITRDETRKKYNIPTNKTVFIYGGNLGKPQGINFLIECLEANKENKNVYFIIVGSGTEYWKLKTFFDLYEPDNAQLFSFLPKEDYELLANSADVGLIFLDSRFTIPNFPSRILTYMQASIPILAAIDVNTDLGMTIEEGEFGYWCESNSVIQFNTKLELLCNNNSRKQMGINARKYIEKNYTVKHSFNVIMNHFK